MSRRKITPAEKRRKREFKSKFMTIFMNGRQKRVPRPPMIEGLPVDEFIARNADPIWLHQHEMWELMPVDGAVPEVEFVPDSIDLDELIPPPPDAELVEESLESLSGEGDDQNSDQVPF